MDTSEPTLFVQLFDGGEDMVAPVATGPLAGLFAREEFSGVLIWGALAGRRFRTG